VNYYVPRRVKARESEYDLDYFTPEYYFENAVAVVFTNIGGNVVNSLRQDLVVITIGVKAALRVHRVF
jgi:hypothetical protein